jgi:hypothetical protein
MVGLLLLYNIGYQLLGYVACLFCVVLTVCIHSRNRMQTSNVKIDEFYGGFAKTRQEILERTIAYILFATDSVADRSDRGL